MQSFHQCIAINVIGLKYLAILSTARNESIIDKLFVNLFFLLSFEHHAGTAWGVVRWCRSHQIDSKGRAVAQCLGTNVTMAEMPLLRLHRREWRCQNARTDVDSAETRTISITVAPVKGARFCQNSPGVGGNKANLPAVRTSKF